MAWGGSALSPGVREAMEFRLRRDLSAVRVHTGPDADALARSVNARAFTHGPDVVFASGQYQPDSREGGRLLAHELVHVAQQGRAPLLRSDPPSDSVLEPASRISRTADSRRVWRVKWNPNRPTGRRSQPWGVGPDGDILSAATDAGTPLDIWRPDDGATYWCHGYTFGGSVARGGPYSIWGSSVPTVLKDDGWGSVYSCLAGYDDTLVFWDRNGQLAHSGRIRTVSAPNVVIDEAASTLESKWGSGSHNTKSWADNAAQYGTYRVYSKSPKQGPCRDLGPHERQ
jgi:hypothetical protein